MVNKKSKSWIIKKHRDPFFKQAKVTGYRSRAVYKLLEIHNRFKILKPNSNLVDLGAAPGGWSQLASEKIRNGKILAVDIKDIQPIKNVKFIKKDFNLVETQEEIARFFDNKIDIIVSDMAADTTGNKDLDCIRTNGLTLDVLSFGKKYLKPGGYLVAKLFMGTDFDLVQQYAKKNFKKIHFFNPEASKKESKETYIVCLK